MNIITYSKFFGWYIPTILTYMLSLQSPDLDQQSGRATNYTSMPPASSAPIIPQVDYTQLY